MVPGFARNWIAVNAVQQSNPQQKMTTKNMTTLRLTKSIGWSPLRLGLPRVQPIWIIRGFLLLPFALAWFAFSPQARAVCRQGCGRSGSTFLGEDALIQNTIGQGNVAIGSGALFSNTTGQQNVAIGSSALLFNNTGNYNTATGDHALFRNTTGHDNTATGTQALYDNRTGYYNTANGVAALVSNTTGSFNTANGFQALYFNTIGSYNTANGVTALHYNTTGGGNTASGYLALYGNDTGNHNTANGLLALYTNTTGSRNTANGVTALVYNVAGISNTASGFQALYTNTTGNENTANGVNALYFNSGGSGNTAEGFRALVNNTGSNNVGLGYNAGFSLTTGSGNVCIGEGVLGGPGENNTTRIRNVYSSVASARPVYVNSENRIGTLVSSRRFKNEIKVMDKTSEAILALKPVTFRYKKEIEPNSAIMFGLIAEEVEKVAPDLVTRNDKGEVETVRYDAVNAMLLNEFLKEHRKNEKQEATIAQLKHDFQSKLSQQQKQIEALTAGLQKVSAQLEASRPALQVANNP
jgi:hypothetical protein